MTHLASNIFSAHVPPLSHLDHSASRPPPARLQSASRPPPARLQSTSSPPPTFPHPCFWSGRERPCADTPARRIVRSDCFMTCCSFVPRLSAMRNVRSDLTYMKSYNLPRRIDKNELMGKDTSRPLLFRPPSASPVNSSDATGTAPHYASTWVL